MSDPEALRIICSGDAVPEGFVVPHYLSDLKLRIALARVDGRFYTFDDLCPCGPIRCPLSAGLLTGTIIMCQCHGSTFDVTNGAVVGGPAKDALKVYETYALGGTIRIRLEAEAV